jgi:hypothetical protein
MNISDVTLSKLAVAGIMFNSLTPYNDSLAVLRSSTGDNLNLTNSEHCKALMKWLNAWGCRHLSEDQHAVATRSILDWYQSTCASLFDNEKSLWELDDQELQTIAHAYGSLKDRVGAMRLRYGNDSEVHIGATAASKILFAIRPKAIMPWDDAMRKSFGYDGSPSSYAKYLNAIRDLTFHIIALCRNKGLQIEDLPKRIGRINSTVLELVNEYIWVTETRKVILPSSETLMQWATLG